MRGRRAGAAVALALAVAAAIGGAAMVGGDATTTEVTITIRYSAFAPETVTVPRGVPVRFSLVNDDPIDHEWIVGDAALHERHRTGAEPVHDVRPTEVSVPALETRETVVVFDEAGTYAMICHLPGHEAHGMVGEVLVKTG